MLCDIGDDYPHDDDLPDDKEAECWRCHGEGWGMIGVDWDTDDAINGPYEGEVVKCDNCRGSGLAKDCWYW